MKLVLLLASVIFTVVPANSMMNVKEYQKMKNSREMKIYLDGIGHGITVVHSYLQLIGQPPFYCPPEKLGLAPENYIDILDKEIQHVPQFQDSIEFLLFNGLMRTFPCGKNKK
jgi:hypothetical protein